MSKRRRQLKGEKKSPSGNGAGPAMLEALAHHQAGRWPEAERAYREITADDAGAFKAHVNLGVVLQEQGRLADAAQSFRRALALDPDFAEGHYALGTVLQEQDDPEGAMAGFRRATDLKPDYVEALNGLAIGLQKQGNPAEAIETFERALRINPQFAEAHNNLGNLYHREGRPEDAMASFRRAIKIAPDYAEAHRNYSQVLLLAGRLDEGWPESRWRWKCKDFPSEKRAFPQAPWSGEPVNGKKVLVWGEQGVGDEVHFAAMVGDLMEAGADVVLESDPRLVPLFGRSFPGAHCVPRETPPAPATNSQDIDFQAPSGNLGAWLRPDLESFPDQASYLVADQDRTGGLRSKYLDGEKETLVGIAWISKNPEVGKEKSMLLEDWRRLAEIPGIKFIDLQYGDTGEERAAFEKDTGVAILHDDSIDQMADLDAFAAQVAAMDLVVSVSNTTVHIAGALGVPTWVLLNAVALPVWMLDRDDSPWYPSLRLFRQAEAGDWADVIERVRDALAAVAAERD